MPTAAKLLFAFALVLLQARGCGFTPDERRGEGEPCTRTSECEVFLECRGGVCMREAPPIDAGRRDGGDPGRDAGALDAGELDAGALDAGELDAGELDAGAVDAGTIDAGTIGDGGSTDAATDGGGG